MKHVFFGLGRRYDNGAIPAISVNRHGAVLEVHRQQVGSRMFYTVGALRQAGVEWQGSTPFDSGNRPLVAMNANNLVAIVNERGAHRLIDIRIGVIEGRALRWTMGRIGYDHGKLPSVAVNDENFVLEMHNSWGTSRAWHTLWRYQNGGLVKLDHQPVGTGLRPRVAMNNRRDVVEVHYASNVLWCRVGRITPQNRLGFLSSEICGQGREPSVALTDDGLVIMTYEAVRMAPDGGLQRTRTLFQRTGRIAGSRIEWDGPAVQYDAGDDCSVAAAGTMAVEAHEGRLAKTLWSSSSLIVPDRASWMRDRLPTLGDRRLRDLILPASHDAGMYTARSVVGRPWAVTQDLNIYEQLSYGIRWFDLRPRWDGRKFVIVHGTWTGPDLSEVLRDIKKFASEENRRELVILKFSHFNNIDNDRYAQLTEKIRASLGEWLVNATPGKKRLAEVTLNEYVANGTAILIVVDRNYAIDVKRDGFWVYRKQNAVPAEHDLRVFDVFSNEDRFTEMRRDQFDKFRNYNGLMEQAPTELCDLFLLSWTLTPQPPPGIPHPVRTLADMANRELGEEIWYGRAGENQIPNHLGKIMNLLYVDYVQYSRVTDVALMHNDAREVIIEAAPAKRRTAARKKARPKGRIEEANP